jgi:UDPglucose 6-dehydrogenase
MDFLNSGIGFGGSCFPKDLDAFIHICESLGYDFKLLKEVKRINQEQRLLAIKKIKDVLWILKDKKIAIWGGAFKPNTDDIRGAPAIEIIEALLEEGARVCIYDPQALKNLESIFENRISYAGDKYQAAEGADCLLLVTEWDEFKRVDFDYLKKVMHLAFIVDGRNLYPVEEVEERGFIYLSFGRVRNIELANSRLKR